MVRTGSTLWDLWSRGQLAPSDLSSLEWSYLVQFLQQRGWSLTQIAESLGLDLESVRRYAVSGSSAGWLGDLRAERAKDLARVEELLAYWYPRAFENKAALDMVRRLLEYRMRLLGLDRVAEVEDPSVAVWREAAQQLQVVPGGSGSGSDTGSELAREANG